MSKKSGMNDDEWLKTVAQAKPGGGYQAADVHLNKPPGKASVNVSLEQMLDNLDTKKGGAGEGIEIPLSHLVEVAGRKRYLTPEQYQELRDNLAKHPLTHQILVRPPINGKYEVVAGHNRIQAYRELGRETIPALVRSMDDDQAILAAFYSNMLSHSLPDYEKFKGFQHLAARFKKSQLDMAKESGMSQATMSRIFAFEKLPPAVLDLLDSTPNKELLACAAAAKLAALVEQGRGKKVVEAVQKLVAGDFGPAGQGAAVAYASQKDESKPERQAIEIRQGKKNWCKVIRTPKDLRLSFINESALDQKLVDEVVAFLKTKAE